VLFFFKGFDCKIYDYVNGYNDLRNNIVKFVGVADKRVKEDYLRILRYFRFFSKVSNDPNKHDENSIKAIKDNVEGLGGILDNFLSEF
jgi:tRNA nucleotidyltransferase (CCA-adding enzyme)